MAAGGGPVANLGFSAVVRWALAAGGLVGEGDCAHYCLLPALWPAVAQFRELGLASPNRCLLSVPVGRRCGVCQMGLVPLSLSESASGWAPAAWAACLVLKLEY